MITHFSIRRCLRAGTLMLACWFHSVSLHAQLVSTIAGQAGVGGEIDGEAIVEARFNNPHGIAVGPRGNVYIADRFNHKIRMLSPEGEVFTLAGTGQVGSQDGPGAMASFHEPWALDVDDEGNLYIADTYNHSIRKLDKQGMVTTLAGSGISGVVDGPANVARFASPSGIAVDANGTIYVCDHLGHTIRKVSPGGFVTTLAGQASAPDLVDGQGAQARFNRPYGLDIGAQGDIFVADEWNHVIRRVTPTGLVSTYAGTGQIGSDDGAALQASFNYPWDLVVDSLGNIFVMDGENHVIRLIDENRTVTTFAGEAGTKGAVDGYGIAASFNGATAIELSQNEANLFVADAYNDLIRQVSVGEIIGLSIENAFGQDSFCVGEMLVLSAFPTQYERYEFFIDGQRYTSNFSPFSELTLDQAGMISLHVEGITSAGERISSETLEIFVMPVPSAAFSHSLVTQNPTGLEVAFQATDSLASSYFWRISSPTSGYTYQNTNAFFNHTFTQWGIYDVSLVTRSTVSCSDSVYQAALINFQEGSVQTATQEFFLPTAFSPNGDQMNDVFMVHGESIAAIDLQIYDEWGQMIFRSTDPAIGWDGTIQGQAAPSDTYQCLLQTTFQDGSLFIHQSPVTIIR